MPLTLTDLYHHFPKGDKDPLDLEIPMINLLSPDAL